MHHRGGHDPSQCAYPPSRSAVLRPGAKIDSVRVRPCRSKNDVYSEISLHPSYEFLGMHVKGQTYHTRRNLDFQLPTFFRMESPHVVSPLQGNNPGDE